MQTEASKSNSADIDRAARTFAYCALIVWTGTAVIAIRLLGWMGVGAVMIGTGLLLAWMHWSTLKRKARK